MVIKGPKQIAPAKIEQILVAGQEQLDDKEYAELVALVMDLQIYGLTPWINARLGELMSELQWELEIGDSPEWEQALVACDRAFLGRELKDMCLEMGISPDGHKKELCARLYQAEVPEVVEIMAPILEKSSIQQLAHILLPQIEHEHLYQTPLREAKDSLEKIYRVSPEEFYRRKAMIKKAIEEREKGKKVKTMPQFSLVDLQELLNFTNRLYG